MSDVQPDPEPAEPVEVPQPAETPPVEVPVEQPPLPAAPV